MNKIKMLTSIAGEDFSIAFGEVVEADGGTAAAWVEAGIAEYVGGDGVETKDTGKNQGSGGASKSGGSKKPSKG